MTDSGLENPHFLFLAFLLNGGFAFYSWSLFLVFKSQVNLKSKNHKKKDNGLTDSNSGPSTFGNNSNEVTSSL